MEQGISTKKIIAIFGSIIVSTVMVFALIFVLFFSNSGELKNAVKAKTDAQGNQLVELVAKNGFTPKLSTIEANKTTLLRVDTNNTFDCSSTISIPKLGISSSLPATGTKDFTIPPQVSGTTIDGTCSMGMYNFTIKVV